MLNKNLNYFLDSKELLVFRDYTIVSTSSSEFIIESKSFCAQSDDIIDNDVLTGAEEEVGCFRHNVKEFSVRNI